ncbi:DUF6153 family protein [Arthrobacter sp. MYb227]|uniref:DUF6153 family protein n=1 Tax=Arthrobacter sp. MYb227 TaxID=1848601 RepID=UPI0011B025C3|nr:DUF6153 family protein [Arthrobacter sp. MYb227]
MSSKPASSGGHGRKSLLGFVLLGSLVVACIIIGLLLMHGLNLHGMSAAPQHTSASVSSMQSNTMVGTSTSRHAVEGIPFGGCADCGAHSQHLVAGAACFLALFGALIILRRPAGKVLRGEWFSCPHRVFSPILGIFTRTPSLQELCISRT